MELQEFITTTLIEIKEGVREANPDGDRCFFMRPKEEKDAGIDFDVAVTVRKEDKKSRGGKVGGKIVVVELGLGGELSSKTSEVATSRIKFSVWPKKNMG